MTFGSWVTIESQHRPLSYSLNLSSSPVFLFSLFLNECGHKWPHKCPIKSLYQLLLALQDSMTIWWLYYALSMPCQCSIRCGWGSITSVKTVGTCDVLLRLLTDLWLETRALLSGWAKNKDFTEHCGPLWLSPEPQRAYGNLREPQWTSEGQHQQPYLPAGQKSPCINGGMNNDEPVMSNERFSAVATRHGLGCLKRLKPAIVLSNTNKPTHNDAGAWSRLKDPGAGQSCRTPFSIPSCPLLVFPPPLVCAMLSSFPGD
jgi:hypothetical protein